jgi:Tol biopolymer transport system component
MKISLSTFDKIVLAILGAVVIVIAVIIWRGDQVGAQIVQTFPVDGGEIGATGKIGIQFNQPMQTKQVESLIRMDPATPGHVVWQGNTLWYLFEPVLQAGTAYHFTLQAGGMAQDGRKVLQDQKINFQVRPPDVIYLATGQNQNEIWLLSPAGGNPRKLTSSGGKVYDFAPSRDGEQIVYSAANAQNGLDLWLIRRDGSQNTILVDCGPDRCSQPTWSPDGSQIVYHRDVLLQSQKNTISGIWGVDLSTDQTDFLISGAQPAWSPDGIWISVMDLQANVIRVLNVQTGKGIEVSASTDFLPQWLPHSTTMIYANVQAAGALETVALFQVDVTSTKVSRLLENLPGDLELSVPAFAPDGKTFLISMRSFTGGLSKQLWYAPADGNNMQQITQDQTFSNASYSWDPWGTQVVFQRLAMGVSSAAPQVLVWDRSKGNSRVLASNAALPAWLP